MDNVELGRRISEARKAAFLSQKELAQYLQLPRSAISLMENGKRTINSLELLKIADILNKDILFFYQDN